MAIYIEHWEVMDNPCGNRLSFAYSDEERDQGFVLFKRDLLLEENGGGAFVRLLRVDRIEDEPQTERSACDTCQWYNSGIPCGVEPSVCKREVEDEPQTERSE